MDWDQRYHRQILLDEIGEVGQSTLRNARVLVIGAGGLACPAIQYLCSSGVGNITVMDADVVGISNLARQVLYRTSDVGRKKVEVLKEVLAQLNDQVQIDPVDRMLSADNVDHFVSKADVVLDCTDNYQVRYILSDSCKKYNVPQVYAALHKYQGQLSVFNYKGGVSYRDVFPDEQSSKFIPTCEVVGVFSPLPGIIGIMQANECLKILLSLGDICSEKMLVYNALNNQQHTIDLN